MKPLKMNLELSRDIFKICKDSIEMKLCYNNTFHVASQLMFSRKLDKSNLKIAYGFVDRKSIGMFFRHAFLIYKEEVIDVTALLWREDIENEYKELDYYTFKEYSFSDFDAYIDDISDNDGYPALNRVLVEEETVVSDKLMQIGLNYNPIDYVDLLTMSSIINSKKKKTI